LAYTVPVRTVELAFEDGDLAGLVVTLRANPSLDDYFTLVELAEAAASAKGLEPIRVLLRGVADVGLVGWNLENGQGPVAATPENFTSHLPPREGMLLVKRYISEIGGLPGPLPTPSGNGKRSAKRPASRRRPSSSGRS
jgi:hypothetical protein